MATDSADAENSPATPERLTTEDRAGLTRPGRRTGARRAWAVSLGMPGRPLSRIEASLPISNVRFYLPLLYEYGPESLYLPVYIFSGRHIHY